MKFLTIIGLVAIAASRRLLTADVYGQRNLIYGRRDIATKGRRDNVDFRHGNNERRNYGHAYD